VLRRGSGVQLVLLIVCNILFLPAFVCSHPACGAGDHTVLGPGSEFRGGRVVPRHFRSRQNSDVALKVSGVSHVGVLSVWRTVWFALRSCGRFQCRNMALRRKRCIIVCIAWCCPFRFVHPPVFVKAPEALRNFAKLPIPFVVPRISARTNSGENLRPS